MVCAVDYMLRAAVLAANGGFKWFHCRPTAHIQYRDNHSITLNSLGSYGCTDLNDFSFFYVYTYGSLL